MERQSHILLFETQQSYCTKEAFFKKKKEYTYQPGNLLLLSFFFFMFGKTVNVKRQLPAGKLGQP